MRLIPSCHSFCYFRLLARKNFATSVASSSVLPEFLTPKSLIGQLQQPFSTTLCLCNNKQIKRGKKDRKSTDIAAIKGTVSTRGVLVDDDEDDDDEDDDGGAVKKGKSNSGSSNNAKALAVEAMQEMEEYLKTLNDALIKHLSLKVNLKVYEDLSVTLENGETHRLIKFARISLKTPNGPVVLNFSDNPAAIKPAKLAIQSMAENVSPQMDGIVIHVPIPKLTRERREELATHSAGLILNEYKLALNEVYKKYTKLLDRSSNNKELVVRLCNGLLAEKRKYDKMGEDKVKERREILLKEIDF